MFIFGFPYNYIVDLYVFRCCMVNKQWRSAIHSDPLALKRKKSFLRSQKLPCQKVSKIKLYLNDAARIFLQKIAFMLRMMYSFNFKMLMKF